MYSWKVSGRTPGVPEELVFWMGKHEARFPVDRRYSTNHMWWAPLEGSTGVYRVGFTAYSVRLLRDVYFLDWLIDAGTSVLPKQEIGEIESSKAVSSLYVPVEGALVGFNEQLLDDPTPINLDNYGSGWLFDFETEAELLGPQAYLEHMQAGWNETQRLIKGQMNE
jgi:glycine cleavage system H protein